MFYSSNFNRRIEGERLSGSLPRSVYLLPFLEVLHLKKNLLHGNITSHIKSLSRLQWLYDNNFSILSTTHVKLFFKFCEKKVFKKNHLTGDGIRYGAKFRPM